MASIALAVGSIAFSAVYEWDGSEGWWMLAEPAAFTALGFLSTRWSSPRLAAAATFVLAVGAALALLRYVSGDGWLAVVEGSTWAVGPILAATAAVFLRRLEAEHVGAVEAARRRQRLDLASDLHDFVAHDVSEIVARAQAGRMVLAGGDERVEALLARIEEAGLRALGSMDQAVHMLRDEAEQGLRPVGGLADLDELVERFGSAGRVSIALERNLVGEVGREVGAVAHRVVAEALTNVRRHAPEATEVRVDVEAAEGLLRVSVFDNGSGAAKSARDGGGSGLAGLAERAESLGGALEAGPHEGGWRTEVRLPLKAEVTS